MSNLLVLYYSRYGQVETMSNAVAEGARSIDGMKVTTKRVSELLSEEAARQAGARPNYPLRLLRPKSSTNTMRLCLARRPGLEIWLRKCVIFSTKLESLDEGSADWPCRQRLYFHRNRGREREHYPDIYPDVVAPRIRSSRSALFVSATNGHSRIPRRVAVRCGEQWPDQMVRGSQLSTSLSKRASKAGTSPRSQRSCAAD
jgi:hypothetical protein